MTACLATVTVIECTRWCSDGTGHLDAEDAADRGCHGDEHRIDLEATPDHLGRPARARVVAHLYRDVYQEDGADGVTTLEPPHIEVQATEPETLRLSIGDARALGRLLLELADEAEGAEPSTKITRLPRPRPVPAG
jgi:hypothetical protein